MANPAPGYKDKPEHRVNLLPETRRVRVTFAGQVVADSTRAVRCEETGHGPVHYIPEQDMRLELMRSYWTLVVDGGKQRSENAVWGYRAPYDEAKGLAGHYAFYPNRVDAIEVI